MDRMRARPEASTSNTATTNAIPDENPFAVELDRLDVFASNMPENPLKSFMLEVVESKRTLLEDSKLVCKLLQLDQLSKPGESVQSRPVKKLKKPKLVKRYNIDDDNDDDEIIRQFADNEERPVAKTEEEGKGEEEMTDEEMPIDELEEENDYMDSYFDNGEDFID